jgi:hypothetical protein
MNELDQAPATATATATETGSREPAGERRPGSSENQARYCVGTAADTDPSYYDGDIQAALAADTTPTRQEAARLDAARDGNANPGHDTTPDNDADIHAILHEDDHLPDARTRQQAAREDAANSGVTTDKDRAAATDQQPRSGPDPLTGTASEKKATTETLPDQATPDNSLTERPNPDARTLTVHGQSGHDVLITVVAANPADRTFADTTPTGIGLKPSGEQILDMESETDSPLARMRHHLYKDMDDVTDVLKENGETVVSLIGERPPTGSHSEISSGHPEITRPAEHGIEGGEIAVAGLLVGMLTYEGTRSVGACDVPECHGLVPLAIGLGADDVA